MSEEQAETKPFVTDEGVLVIPEDCEDKYKWWAEGGQGLAETLKELKVSKSVWMRYVDDPYPEELKKENYPLL